MTDDEIVAQLRASAPGSSAVEVALALGHLAPDGLTQGSIVTYFKRAFPGIPLRTLLDAWAWHRVGAGGLSDSDFDALLRPWWPTKSR